MIHGEDGAPDVDECIRQAMPDQGNGRVCRVYTERQGRSTAGMPDKLQQCSYGRHGQ